MIKLNTSAFLPQYNKFARRVSESVQEQIMDDLDQVLEESKREIPVDTGAALHSAYSDYVGGTFVVGYGDKYAQTNPKTGQSTNEYLLKLHEDLYVPHKNGKAKFLEDPFRRYLQRVKTDLPRMVRRRIGG